MSHYNLTLYLCPSQIQLIIFNVHLFIYHRATQLDSKKTKLILLLLFLDMLNPLTLLVTLFLVYVLPFEVTKQLQTNKLDKLVRERAIMQDISAFAIDYSPFTQKKKTHIEIHQPKYCHIRTQT